MTNAYTTYVSYEYRCNDITYVTYMRRADLQRQSYDLGGHSCPGANSSHPIESY